MDASLKGKVAVVTGGSRGIGFAIARACVERGADVTITGTKEQALAAASRALEAHARGGAVMNQTADVRRYEDVERMLNATVSRFGGIDILVNNAGVGIFASVGNMSADQWREVIDTNLTGVFYCCHSALPHLRQRGGGWIINISSLSGTNPFVEGGAYCASKAALNAFSESLMQEVRHEGIRVAYVMPGSVNTGFMGRAPHGEEWKLAPEDIAEVVTDLIAHPSRSLPSRVEIRPARPPKKG
jgi:3-oxoacyl-[acyl-carrier protein] reductase